MVDVNLRGSRETSCDKIQLDSFDIIWHGHRLRETVL